MPDEEELEYYDNMDFDQFCEVSYDDDMDVETIGGVEQDVGGGSGRVVGDDSFSSSEDASKGIFYNVQGGENDMYLFGSIHYGREDMYPLREEINDAFISSDELVQEIDMASITLEETQEILERSTYDYPDERLSDVISEETFERLLGHMEPLGVDEDTLETYRPWFAVSQLTEMAFHDDSSGYGPEMGIEEFFMAGANEEGIETAGLETMESQISTFDIMSEESKEIYVSGSLDELEPDYEGVNVDDMISFWREGDLEQASAMREDFIDDAGTDSLREFAEALTIERDSEMAEKLIEMLEDGEEDQYFVVVGYLHLVGEESIVENLRDSGYDVEIVY